MLQFPSRGLRERDVEVVGNLFKVVSTMPSWRRSHIFM